MGDVIPIGFTSAANSDTAPVQIGVTEGGVPIFAEEAMPTPPLQEREFIWTCNHCGCQSFQLLESGVTCCVRCAHRSCDAAGDGRTDWRSHLPNLPLNLDDVPPLGLENSIIDYKPTPLILKSMANAILKEDPVLALVVRRDGSMRMWSEGVFNDEQEAWFKERLNDAAAYFLTRSVDEELPTEQPPTQQPPT